MSCGVPGSAYEAAEQWGPRETTLRRVIIPREHNLRLVEAGETKVSFTKSLVLKQIEQNKLWIGVSRGESLLGDKWRTEMV